MALDIAVIPARSGSKRIPGKNWRLFNGKPLIAYSIGAALDCGLFERVVVSTDSDEVARIAQGFGADVPFLRPPNLADDFTGTGEVVRHAIIELEQAGQAFDGVCCIYATAPLLEAKMLIRAERLLRDSDAEMVFPVTSYSFPIQRALRLDGDQRPSMFWPEYADERSQDLAPAFHDAGMFYYGYPTSFVDRLDPFSARSKVLKLPRTKVIDIDTEEDWEVAELLYRAVRGGGH